MPQDKAPIGPDNAKTPDSGLPPAEQPITPEEEVKIREEATHRDIDKGLADFTELLQADKAGNRDLLDQGEKAAATAHEEAKVVAETPVSPASAEPALDKTPVATPPEYFPAAETTEVPADSEESIVAARQARIDQAMIDTIGATQAGRDRIAEEIKKSPENVSAKPIEAGKETKYAKLEYDPRYVDLLEEQCLVYLNTKDKDAFLGKYNGKCSEAGFLLDKDGKETAVLPSECIGEAGLAEAKTLAMQKFASLYPEDYKIYGEPSLEPVLPKGVEKDLGYLDIDPKAIFDKLTPEEMVALQALMKASDQAKINAFYQSKIKEVLADQKKEAVANEDLLKKSAESINDIIQKTVELEAQRQLLNKDLKGKGAMATKVALNVAIMAGTSLMFSSLGIATGGAGVVLGAAGVAGVRNLLRKYNEKQEQKQAGKRRTDQAAELAKKKTEVLQELFSSDNLEKLRQQLSGHIANSLREQSSDQALKALREYQKAEVSEKKEVVDAKLREVEKELYLNALTKVRAEHPEASPDEQKNMALTLALTLGQHERGENLARRKLAEIQKSKPALYRIIEKYNLLSAGKNPDAKPAGMTEEEENIWRKSKYELMSLGIGTAVGVAVRSSGIFRVAAGAVAGAGIGYKIGEVLEQKEEKKVLAEITQMIDEAEKVIKDIEFPTDQIDKLKQDSVLVKSKLDLGLLDKNPLLRSRAENFIHQVQKLELANQESLQKLLASISERTDKRAQQVDDDLDRIGSKIKRTRLWTTIGGAVIGGAAAWAGGELLHKKGGTQQTTHRGSGHTPGHTPPTASQAEVVAATHRAEPLGYATSVEVHHGDTVWSLAKEQLQNRIGHDKWNTYTEAQQTHMIDELKDKVAANPAAFGLHHGVDHLQVGDRVIWTPDSVGHSTIENIQTHATQHTPAEYQNILDNNEAVKAATAHGVHITTDNVDQVAAAVRQHGVAYVGHDGSVHDWAWHGQAVDRQPGGDFVVAETGQHLKPEHLNDVLNQRAEKASDIVHQEAASHASQETAVPPTADQVIKQNAEQFMASGDASHYNHDVYIQAKSGGQLEQVFSKVLESKSQAGLEHFIRDWAVDHEMSKNQQDIFLASIKSNDSIDLSLGGQLQVKGLEVLSQDYEAFKNSLLQSFDDLKHIHANGEWHPVRVGNEYALVQKFHTSIWPVRHDHWLVDTNGDYKVDMTVADDGAMKTIFTRHSFVVHPDSPAVPVMAENLNHETASSSSLTPESHQAAEVTRQAATASPAGEKIDTTPPKDWSKEINDAIENAMGKK